MRDLNQLLLNFEHKQNFKRVAVVGSGIAGCSTAYHLAKNGHAVEIFEINEITFA